MNVVEKNLLRDLMKNGHGMERRKLVKRLPTPLRPKALQALLKLEESGYVVQDFTQEGWIVSIPKFMVPDVIKRISSIYGQNYPKAIEELIPKKYSAPFHVSKGEHMSRHGVATYALCSKIKDNADITCFIIKDDEYTSIHLGSIYDQKSLVSRFLKEIDTKIGEDKEFTKEYLQTILPKNIVKNRQPLKALTEYLCHIGFLDRIEYPQSTKFKRTVKVHKVTTLDEVMVQTKSEKPTTPAITMITGNAKYSYSEEDGLYAVLY